MSHHDVILARAFENTPSPAAAAESRVRQGILDEVAKCVALSSVDVPMPPEAAPFRSSTVLSLEDFSAIRDAASAQLALKDIIDALRPYSGRIWRPIVDTDANFAKGTIEIVFCAHVVSA